MTDPRQRVAASALACAKRNALAKVGSSHFDLFYLHLINGLPGAKFAPGAGPLDFARFVFDGGEGILMPMKQ